MSTLRRLAPHLLIAAAVVVFSGRPLTCIAQDSDDWPQSVFITNDDGINEELDFAHFHDLSWQNLSKIPGKNR